MNLRSGIPLQLDVDTLVKSPLYAEHTDYNKKFLASHGQALEGYGKLWGQDPFQLWSRRWEYPYVIQRVLEYGATKPGQPLKMLDGGSGVTYVPYFLCDKLPNLSVICCDTNTSYAPMFEAINKNAGHQKVTFQEAMLQKLPYETGSLDIIACISVLEHTDNYGQIIAEFARALKPGGLLVLTFDLSLDGKFELSKPMASELLDHVLKFFDVQNGLDVKQELNGMDSPSNRLTTDHVKTTQPELLPWRFPLLKGVHDMIKGHGWTGGFRSKSVFCLSAIRK